MADHAYDVFVSYRRTKQVRQWVTKYFLKVAGLRAATTACLTVPQRQRLLSESAADAAEAFERCERGYGRTAPPRTAAAPLSEKVIGVPSESK